MRVGIPWPSSTTPSSDVGWFGSSFLNRMMVWRLLDIFLSGLGFSSKTHSHLTPSSSSLHSSCRFRSIGDAVNEFLLWVFSVQSNFELSQLVCRKKDTKSTGQGFKARSLELFFHSSELQTSFQAPKSASWTSKVHISERLVLQISFKKQLKNYQFSWCWLPAYAQQLISCFFIFISGFQS